MNAVGSITELCFSGILVNHGTSTVLLKGKEVPCGKGNAVYAGLKILGYGPFEPVCTELLKQAKSIIVMCYLCIVYLCS